MSIAWWRGLPAPTALQLVVTPAAGTDLKAPASPGTQTYLAADAALTDAQVYSLGSQSNYNGYATAGGKDVGSIDKSDSRVAFTVNVLNWLFRSHQDQYLDLTAGTHAITFGVSDPSIGTAKGQVTLDDIQLTYAPYSVPGVTGPGTSYPAAYADLSGTATTVPCDGAACLAPQSVVLRSGGSVSFAVDAGSDGFYSVTPAARCGPGWM
jgi:hypothetical protein